MVSGAHHGGGDGLRGVHSWRDQLLRARVDSLPRGQRLPINEGCPPAEVDDRRNKGKVRPMHVADVGLAPLCRHHAPRISGYRRARAISPDGFHGHTDPPRAVDDPRRVVWERRPPQPRAACRHQGPRRRRQHARVPGQDGAHGLGRHGRLRRVRDAVGARGLPGGVGRRVCLLGHGDAVEAAPRHRAGEAGAGRSTCAGAGCGWRWGHLVKSQR
mmetsp:Transcript_65119/g.187385  ORF Transcript_65119/g.187385 Transcript_65119/m.187385 type:complete len:215 (-) Transcript_65119:145-789(-)